ncbi:hypothetical protein ACSBR2_003455 [Camellia fascicularis]
MELLKNSRVQDKLNKSQRIRHKSMQFNDNLSQDENPRLIYVNDPRKTNDKYEFTENEIRTSKYTVINFLPKNLFIQFYQVAYLYFSAIAALNQLPPLAVFGRTVSLFPLLFVLCVMAVKDGYEDWRRHRSDLNENNRVSLVLQSGKFQFKKWKKLRVGEVVKICADETIPCDMVLLGTHDASGIAYIQTMNLDGESNLKTRYARQETTSMVFEGCTISGLIRCEQPNRNIRVHSQHGVTRAEVSSRPIQHHLAWLSTEEHRMGSRCGGLCWSGNKGNAEQCNVSFQKKQTGKLHEQRNPVVVCFSSHHVLGSCPWNGSMASVPQ